MDLTWHDSPQAWVSDIAQAKVVISVLLGPRGLGGMISTNQLPSKMGRSSQSYYSPPPPPSPLTLTALFKRGEGGWVGLEEGGGEIGEGFGREGDRECGYLCCKGVWTLLPVVIHLY